MPIGAGIAAAGSIGGAVIGAGAAKSAAKTQAAAANRASDIQLGMFNTIRDDLSPYRNFGASALPGMAQLMGISMPAAAPHTMPSSSSYDFGTGGFSAGGLTGGAAASPYGAIPSVGDPNWGKLLTDRPDVMAEFQRASSTADRNSPVFLQKGLDSPENYAKHWYTEMGGSSGYAVPTWSAEDLAAKYPSAGGQAAAPLGGQSGSAGIQSFLESLPGYQFTRDQGMQAVENKLTARGLGGLSGSLGKGLARFVSGLADSTYQQQLDNFYRVAGMGQSAANQTGAYGSTAASNAGSALVGAGAASAAGTVGAANAISGGISGASNAYLTSKILGGGGGGVGMYSGAAVPAAYAPGGAAYFGG